IGRAADSKSACWEFESLHPCHLQSAFLCMKKGHSLSGLFAICDLFYRRFLRRGDRFLLVVPFAFTTRPPLANRYPFFRVPLLFNPALAMFAAPSFLTLVLLGVYLAHETSF
ncbi:hypothetical protein L3V35_12440, partial [Vibrio sp. L5-1]|nr:hypothetical protein [Vibrio sp. L5-1]